MKTLTSILILVLISIQAFSQTNSDKALYEQKIIKYTRMKRTGTVLTIAGGVLTTVGVVILSNSSYSTVSNGYGYSETHTEGNPGLGVLCFITGTGGLGAGIPLMIVGSKAKRKYEDKLQSLSLKLNVNPNHKGFALTYRF
jgi:hypothetical protein